MISEREMVLDALETVKHEIVDFTKAAEEASNPKVRQAFLQFRDKAEQTKMKVEQVATQNGWYIPSQPADHREISQIKQFAATGTKTILNV